MPSFSFSFGLLLAAVADAATFCPPSPGPTDGADRSSLKKSPISPGVLPTSLPADAAAAVLVAPFGRLRDSFFLWLSLPPSSLPPLPPYSDASESLLSPPPPPCSRVSRSNISGGRTAPRERRRRPFLLMPPPVPPAPPALGAVVDGAAAGAGGRAGPVADWTLESSSLSLPSLPLLPYPPRRSMVGVHLWQILEVPR